MKIGPLKPGMQIKPLPPGSEPKHTIYWLSRHKPLGSQLQELERLFGPCLLVYDPNSFTDAQDIINRMKEWDADELAIVAPLSVIAKLTEAGVHPLWAEMEVVPKEEAEAQTGGRYYRFVKFRRIKAVKLEFEELA